MCVADGHSAHVNRQTVSLVMPQVHVGIARLTIAKGAGQRAVITREFAIAVIALNQDVLATQSSDYALAEIASDFFRTFVPE